MHDQELLTYYKYGKVIFLSHSQVGADPDHSMLSSHNLVGIPASRKLSLQSKVATVPATKLLPLLGKDE